MTMRNVGNGLDVGIIEHRIADCLDVERLGFSRNGFFEIFGVFGINEPYGNAEFGQYGVKLCIRSAVKVVCRNNFVAGFGKGNDGIKNRRGS